MSILQSDAWAALQRNLGYKVIQRSGDGWRYLAIVKGGRAWRYLNCPYGPEASTPQAFDSALADLVRNAQEHRCWFVRVEPAAAELTSGLEAPEDALRRRGLRRAPRDAQPSHTQIVDLTKDEGVLLGDMESTNRNLHRNIHKKGVTITSSTDPEDIEILLPLLDAVAARERFNRREDAYLREAARTLMPMGVATLYVARLHGEPIGASLAYDWDDTRVYAHTAMDGTHRKLNAGKPLVIRMMLDAKHKGLTRFDFYGTAPEGAGPEHEWYGFTTFKKSFGGYPESYPGTWDLPISRVKYAAFPVLRTVRARATMGRRAVQRYLARVRGVATGR